MLLFQNLLINAKGTQNDVKVSMESAGKNNRTNIINFVTDFHQRPLRKSQDSLRLSKVPNQVPVL